MLRHSNLRLTLALLGGGVLWAIIIYKAIYIPITHDEAPTPTHYVHFGIWQIMMYPDNSPNNHILNTLLTKFAMYLFGNGQWAVRLPNILSFGVYFYAVYQISKTLFSKDNLLLFGCLAAFLCNPFLLDFFSVCRGYGLSNALLLCSVLFCLKAYFHQKEQAIWWSLVFAVLASYANFTLLVFWSAMNIMAFLFFVNQYQKGKNFLTLFYKTALIGIGCIAYAALIYIPIHKMQSTGQFAPWQSNGFFQDTIVSLVQNTMYGSKILDVPPGYLAMMVVTIFIISGMVLLYYGWKYNWKRVSNTPLLVAFLILALAIIVNVLQTILLHTPNLTTRTALFFYPLFIFLISTGLYHLANRNLLIARVISSVILILGIWHLARTVTLDRVREWWFDANTFQVLQTIEKEANKKQSPIYLKTNWIFYPSLDFYVLTGKAPYLKLGDYYKDIDSLNYYDYYYIFESDYPLLKSKYEIEEKYDGGARLLLKHK